MTEVSAADYYAGEPCANCGHGVLEHDDQIGEIQRVCRMGPLWDPCLCLEYLIKEEKDERESVKK
jgi:hypothetical protein